MEVNLLFDFAGTKINVLLDSEMLLLIDGAIFVRFCLINSLHLSLKLFLKILDFFLSFLDLLLLSSFCLLNRLDALLSLLFDRLYRLVGGFDLLLWCFMRSSSAIYLSYRLCFFLLNLWLSLLFLDFVVGLLRFRLYYLFWCLLMLLVLLFLLLFMHLFFFLMSVMSACGDGV